MPEVDGSEDVINIQVDSELRRQVYWASQLSKGSSKGVIRVTNRFR